MKFHQLWVLWTVGCSVIAWIVFNNFSLYGLLLGEGDNAFILQLNPIVFFLLTVFIATIVLLYRFAKVKLLSQSLNRLHFYFTLLASGLLYYKINQDIQITQNTIYRDSEVPYHLDWSPILTFSLLLLLAAQIIFIYNLATSRSSQADFLFTNDKILDA